MFHLKYKNPILVLLLAIAVLINGAIIYLIYEQGRLSVEDSSAAVEPKLVLNLNTPASTEGMAAGSNFKLDVKVQSPNGTSVSELVLKFDPAILEAKLITESSNLLALNKKIDNVAGKATIDVSTSGSGAFAETLTLATFEFTLKTAGGTTAVAVDPASTLGYPNKLTATGYGKIDLNFATIVKNAKLILTKTAPAGAVTTTGTDISVSLTAQNTQNISVGEIVVEFDQAVLEGKAIVESSSIIALNKSINNTTGKITVDISLSGPGSFTADSNLVNFIFTAKTLAQSSTTVKIGTTSTFGIPNKIATDGFGTLSIPIQLPTAVCGNSKIESNEQCDDGNLVNNDGCSSICRTETAATSCGDGTVQKPNSAGVIEICDDGNTSNADSCSNNCLNSCTSPKIWNGSTCRNPLAVGCKGDYNATGTVDISDFQILAQNYRTNGITCNLDISGSPCYLDINDFSEFAKIYKQNNQCKL